MRGFWEDSWAASHGIDEATAMATDRYRMTRETETAAMLAADAVVTLSETMRHEIIERGVPAERLTVVPNAVEIEDFEPVARDDAIAASLGIDVAKPVVGYISSLNAYEGIECLLEAASRLRSQDQKLRVLVVGEGDQERAIRETGRRLGLDDGTLIMPGRVPHDRILGYYALIDVFVVPRTANRVSRLVTPLKPFEAMALERALVVSDLPALREIVTPGETGMTFKAGDADDLARVLSDLLGDPGAPRPTRPPGPGMDQDRADLGAERQTLSRALRAAWRRLSDAGVPARAQPEDLARPRRPAEQLTVSTTSSASLVEAAPVDRPVGRDDDHDVGPARSASTPCPSRTPPAASLNAATCGSWKRTSAPRSASPLMTSAAGELRSSWTSGLKATPMIPTVAPLSARPRSLSASATRSTTCRGIARLMSPASSMKRSTKSNSRARHDR